MSVGGSAVAVKTQVLLVTGNGKLNVSFYAHANANANNPWSWNS